MRIFIWVFVLAISFFSCKKEKPLVDNKVESVISDTIILGTAKLELLTLKKTVLIKWILILNC